MAVNVHLFFGSDSASGDIARRRNETYAVGRWADLRRDSDYAYSRDIIARIEELKDDDERDDEDQDELEILEVLAEECNYGDWEYGATLIRDSYFKEYAQDLADDIGAIARNAVWPTTCIDWDQAADDLKQDYNCVDFDGVEYWLRA